MIYQSAYYGGDNSGIHVPSDEFLHVNNTGYYKDMPAKQLWGTNRPAGLSDWQVLYVLAGEMKHEFAEHMTDMRKEASAWRITAILLMLVIMCMFFLLAVPH
jgi:hypothetical protein